MVQQKAWWMAWWNKGQQDQGSLEGVWMHGSSRMPHLRSWRAMGARLARVLLRGLTGYAMALVIRFFITDPSPDGAIEE